MNYKRFFLTSGTGTSTISRLNALDKALMHANISQCNLVKVSSILAPDAKETQPTEIPAGTITHCVLATIDGQTGQETTAGIAYAQLEDQKGKHTYGIVAEDTGHYNQKTCTNNLNEKILEMAEARKMKITKNTVKTITTTIPDTPNGTYTHAIAALIYAE
ncbi:MAG: pyruvoyl-dependent arginine decarboxylase [Candidatus Altiarchaeota archaeon]